MKHLFYVKMNTVKDKKTKATTFAIIAQDEANALVSAQKYGEPDYCLPNKFLLGPDWQR